MEFGQQGRILIRLEHSNKKPEWRTDGSGVQSYSADSCDRPKQAAPETIAQFKFRAAND
jgi:hypothetical protein